jgi:hypothetical protein
VGSHDPSKNCAASSTEEIQAWAEDEFTAREFTEYYATEGVYHQHTTPYSPQQNSIIECQNGTVVVIARSMLKAKGLLGWFLGEAGSIVV